MRRGVRRVAKEDWIHITDHPKDCQQDFIVPTQIVDGQLKRLVNNEWSIVPPFDKHLDFEGLSNSEKLHLSGLTDEFAQAELNDPEKASKIRKALGMDE